MSDIEDNGQNSATNSNRDVSETQLVGEAQSSLDSKKVELYASRSLVADEIGGLFADVDRYVAENEDIEIIEEIFQELQNKMVECSNMVKEMAHVLSSDAFKEESLWLSKRNSELRGVESKDNEI